MVFAGICSLRGMIVLIGRMTIIDTPAIERWYTMTIVLRIFEFFVNDLRAHPGDS